MSAIISTVVFNLHNVDNDNDQLAIAEFLETTSLSLSVYGQFDIVHWVNLHKNYHLLLSKKLALHVQ